MGYAVTCHYATMDFVQLKFIKKGMANGLGPCLDAGRALSCSESLSIDVWFMPGDELKGQVVRSGKVLELAYTLQQSRPLVPALHGVECVPSYFIVAGLVFVPLSIPFLEHAYGSKLSPWCPFVQHHSGLPCSHFWPFDCEETVGKSAKMVEAGEVSLHLGFEGRPCSRELA